MAVMRTGTVQVYFIPLTSLDTNYDALEYRAEVIRVISEAAAQEGNATVIQDGDTEYAFDDWSACNDIQTECKNIVRDHKSWTALFA